MLKKLIQTQNDAGAFVARIALGLVMFPHGAQKVLGWFGGYGPAGTAAFMHDKLGIPTPLAYLNFAAEFFGSILLVFGLLGRLSAFGIGVSMVVAALLAHVANGFFMDKGGFEYHILAVALSLIVMIKGSGAFSLDRALSRKSAEEEATKGARSHEAPRGNLLPT